MNTLLLVALAAIPVDAWFEPGDELPDAIDRIQRSEFCETGCTVELSASVYETTRPVVSCRSLRIVGQGGFMDGIPTEIRTSSTAIKVAGADECAEHGLGRGGQGTTVEHVHLRGNISNVVLRRTAGIWLEARADVSHVFIDNFTNGVRISAGHNRQRSEFKGWFVWAGTNANGWSMHRVRIVNSQHAGVYIDGPDVNAGLATMVDVTSSCWEADRLVEMGACAALHESSFLGNTWIAAHFASSKDRRGYMYRPLYSDDANARNTYVGVYSERDGQQPSTNSKNDVVLGGFLAASRPALILQSNSVPGLCFGTVADGTRVCFGDMAGTGAFSIVLDDRNLTLRGKPVLIGEEWALRLDMNNLNSHQVGRFLPRNRDVGSLWQPMLTRTVLPSCGADSSTIAEGLAMEVDEDGTSLCSTR